MSRPVVADRRAAVIFGMIGVVGGAWLLSQAYEARGKDRPLWARVLPAGVR
jgi:hypothetical protein